MESDTDWHGARAALEWQLEMGVTEPVGEVPVNRYELTATAPKPKPEPKPVAAASAPAAAVGPPPANGLDPVAEARVAAAAAPDLPALAAAIAAYDRCDLKKGAKNTVFADGNPNARVMILGEAPGRDEDIQGKPFVGRAGQLLDRMFAAIGLSRDAPDPENTFYISNILPWRPPQNRDPTPEEMAMLMPFVTRHVDLAAPEVLVLMGNTPCQAVLGRRGITRMRGKWTQGLNLPVLPMFHPAYLLRNPAAKRESWADLLELQARLRQS